MVLEALKKYKTHLKTMKKTYEFIISKLNIKIKI